VGEWINTDKCECIVDRQDDGVRRQSGKFKAVLDEAKEAFFNSNLKLFPNSSEEESKEGGLVSFLVGDVKPTGYILVVKPCGLKQNAKQEAISQLREDRKRRKADLDDPMYAPDVPRKKNSNKKSDTAIQEKFPGDSFLCKFCVYVLFNSIHLLPDLNHF
jgi:hypothetical protein